MWSFIDFRTASLILFPGTMSPSLIFNGLVLIFLFYSDPYVLVADWKCVMKHYFAYADRGAIYLQTVFVIEFSPIRFKCTWYSRPEFNCFNYSIQNVLSPLRPTKRLWPKTVKNDLSISFTQFFKTFGSTVARRFQWSGFNNFLLFSHWNISLSKQTSFFSDISFPRFYISILFPCFIFGWQICCGRWTRAIITTHFTFIAVKIFKPGSRFRVWK